MIFIGLGANLPSEAYGPPEATCEAALDLLGVNGVRVLRRSRWYLSRPVPPSGQPWFVNGVADVETALEPVELLALMHRIEAETGRVRGDIDGPRVLDLDLLDYAGRLSPDAGGGTAPTLPHPRLHQRAFVLYPLQELVPDWRHPETGTGIKALISALSPDQICHLLETTPAPP